jgi:hypothetical protein
MQKILREKDEKREFLFKSILSKRLVEYPDVLNEIIQDVQGEWPSDDNICGKKQKTCDNSSENTIECELYESAYLSFFDNT